MAMGNGSVFRAGFIKLVMTKKKKPVFADGYIKICCLFEFSITIK